MGVKPETLVDVQVLLEDSKLTEQLKWRQHGNLVIAEPKRRLSDTVFKEILRRFKLMGGDYVTGRGFQVKLTSKKGEGAKGVKELEKVLEKKEEV